MNTQTTTVLYLQGLAITCFNKEKKRSETVLLRQAKHQLSLIIEKVTNQTREIICNFQEKDGDLPRQDLIINVSGSGNPQVVGYEKYEPTKFDRLNETETNLHHLKWIIDLENEELHNKMLTPTGTSNTLHNQPLTKLFIENANFSTEAITQYKLAKIEKVNNIQVLQRPFGKIGYIMKSEIIADEILVDITGKNSISLKAETDSIYKIYIDNLREFGDFVNDTSEYYKVVQDTDNREFDFVKMTSSSGSYNCSGVILGETQSLDNFA